MAFSLSDFDFELPESLIAQQPAERRDASRLLVLDRSTGAADHRRFVELPEFLRDDDVLVLNNTRVIPARFFCRRSSGGRIEGLYVHADPAGDWVVLLKNAGRCKADEVLAFESDDSATLTLLENLGRGRWRVRPSSAESAEALLQRVGQTPLPPYIRRPDGQEENDPRRYQTVYAESPGAVAAPTAGLHFTSDMLDSLKARGLEILNVTLHVGLGTFLPVTSEDLAEHDMHTERFELSGETAEAINAAKREGRRIVAVGTTSVRVLESMAKKTGPTLQAGGDETNLFLYPPAEFHIVDAMLTNFHLPKSTLLMLVAAFCRPGGTEGLSLILEAYRHAVERKYRFFSYGDAMLIV